MHNKQTFLLACLAGALMWCAFPPVGLWWLGWLATAPLVWLTLVDELPGKRPYRQLFFAGFFYWLAAYYFIRIPHWLLNFGWVALAVAFAIYTPLFVAATRALIHRWKLPAILAVPVVWTGIEWMRSNFFTGLAMGCLSHSQYAQPSLIQIADLSGAYTLSFAMLVFTTGLTQAVFGRTRSGWRWPSVAWPAAVGVVVLLAVIGYGRFRLNEALEYRSDQTLTVGVIQPSIDKVFRPISDEERNERWSQHRDLTQQARQKWDDLELILWPESGFDSPDLLSDVNEQATAAYFVASNQQLYRVSVAGDSGEAGPPLLTGGLTHDPANNDVFNSALLFSPEGQVVDRYYKGHRVLFGEYVPLAEWFPALDSLTPIGKGLSRGQRFRSIEVAGVKLAPSVCFESCVPHYIRRQVNTLAAAGDEPDVLVNLTNDGWFFGTACLDLHLASNVFRAVEMRKPHLVCANTGFSAEIDSCGRLRQTGPRREQAVLRADVRPVRRSSMYRAIGDVIPMSFAMLTLAAIAWQLIRPLAPKLNKT